MKRSKRVTYTYTPDEVSELLRDYHKNSAQSGAKVDVKFNVRAKTTGFGTGEMTTHELETIDVVVEEP